METLRSSWKPFIPPIFRKAFSTVVPGVTYDDLPDGACFRRPPLHHGDYPATPLPSPLPTPMPSPLSTPTPTPGPTRPGTPALAPTYAVAPSATYTSAPSGTYHSVANGTYTTPVSLSSSSGIVAGPFMTPTIIPPTSVVAIVEYTGSFTVVGPDQASRTEYVRNKLNQMREGAKSKPVLLVISLAGVKVCSPDGKSVHMAHALRRISYATCDPENRQFSFLAREPKGHFSLQYCHAFLTHTPDQGAAASRDSSPSPNMRTPGSPALAQSPSHSSLGGLQKPSSLPGLHTHPENDNILHSPDSENSNSPSELNSTKRLADKPPLIKKLSVTLESTLNLEEDLRPLVTSSSSSSSPSCHTTTCVTTGSSSSSTTSTAVVGYVNEKVSDAVVSSVVSSTDVQDHHENDNKCRISDDVKLKRISQISVSSSASSGVVGLDVSTSSTRSATPPPLPERSDSLTPPEEPHLKTAAWFQAGIPREIALEVLSHEPVGAFMVRESTSKPGCYALSLRVPRDFTVSGIAHYLIVKTNRGYKIKGFTKEFNTLTALITHHSVMPELLPCPLSLSRYNPTFTSDDQNRNDSNDDDPDYNTLSDFRKMMADLNV
ncbi:EGFR adapter protein-like isoform X4 [Palaemon carinicauda]|uniref:EGFR adapter protein-like isoform X4 n=1 Tax=Palaemon carinicauda TaxID=392227 RepID=UPI0035B63DAE